MTPTHYRPLSPRHALAYKIAKREGCNNREIAERLRLSYWRVCQHDRRQAASNGFYYKKGV